MSDENFAFYSGRLTRDPEGRKTPDGIDVCDLTVASNRWVSGRQLATYMRVTCWDKTATHLLDPEKGIKKGDHVTCKGVMVNDDYEYVKGDPTSKTHGRMKMDNAKVTILVKKPMTSDEELLEI